MQIMNSGHRSRTWILGMGWYPCPRCGLTVASGPVATAATTMSGMALMGLHSLWDLDSPGLKAPQLLRAPLSPLGPPDGTAPPPHTCWDAYGWHGRIWVLWQRYWYIAWLVELAVWSMYSLFRNFDLKSDWTELTLILCSIITVLAITTVIKNLHTWKNSCKWVMFQFVDKKVHICTIQCLRKFGGSLHANILSRC